MSDRSESFDDLRRTRYEKHWELLEKYGVKTPLEYLAGIYSDDRSPVENPEAALRQSEEIDIASVREWAQPDEVDQAHWLARFYPAHEDQSVSIVLQEPRLGSDGNIGTNEERRLANIDSVDTSGLDLSEMAEVSVHYYVDYLAGELGSESAQDHLRTLISYLNADQNSIGSGDTPREYYQIPSNDNQTGDTDRYERRDVDPTRGVWADFYITNVYLLSDFDELTYEQHGSPRKDLKRELAEEINYLNLDLIIPVGGHAWKAIKKYAVDKNNLKIIVQDGSKKYSNNITDVQGNLYRDGRDRMILPTSHVSEQGQFDEDAIKRPAKRAGREI